MEKSDRLKDRAITVVGFCVAVVCLGLGVLLLTSIVGYGCDALLGGCFSPY